MHFIKVAHMRSPEAMVYCLCWCVCQTVGAGCVDTRASLHDEQCCGRTQYLLQDRAAVMAVAAEFMVLVNVPVDDPF